MSVFMLEAVSPKEGKKAKRELEARLSKKGTWRTTNKKRRGGSNILDGVAARPRDTLEHTWAAILRTWLRPPAKILDATAGKKWMWRQVLDGNGRLIEGEVGYDVVFSDSEPQEAGVIKADARFLGRYFEAHCFDALVVDPPYRRDVSGGRYDIQNFRGDPAFNLQDFFANLNVCAPEVLKENGTLIVKIGDARIKGKFEPWDMFATQLLDNFVLEDRVIRRPFYARKIAINRRDRATLTHETFLLYSIKPKEGAQEP